jgi:putative transposase
MLDRSHPELSVRRQCELAGVARSGAYRGWAAPAAGVADPEDLELMRRIDELFMAWPFLGSRRMALMLSSAEAPVNRKRVQRLTRRMGIAALGPRPNTSIAAPGRRIYPYLPRNLTIDRPGQVWAADITDIPMGRGFLYLMAVIDWASRAMLAWRLSNTMDVTFRVEALEAALADHAKPEIFNTDQGAQFTSAAFTGVLERAGVTISIHRPRPVDGQCLHRATVAIPEVRGHLPEGLRGWSGGQGRIRRMDRVLQQPTPARRLEGQDPDGGVVGRPAPGARQDGCGHAPRPGAWVGRH